MSEKTELSGEEIRCFGLIKVLIDISSEYKQEEFIKGIFGFLSCLLVTGNCTSEEASEFSTDLTMQFVKKFNETRKEKK